MSSITRYSPFDLLDIPTPTLRVFQDAMNRMMNEPSSARPWVPAVDVFETENELVLKADVPEVEMKDIDIRLENGTLSLRGERKFESATKEGGFHRLERGYGRFERYFTLPETVDAEKVSADYKNGVLTVTLPKKEIAKPRQIRVQVNS